jgi:hypothetical protein
VVRLPGILSGSGYDDARNPVLYPDGSLRLKVGVVMFAPDDKRFEWFHDEFSENTLPFTIVANRPQGI